MWKTFLDSPTIRLVSSAATSFCKLVGRGAYGLARAPGGVGEKNLKLIPSTFEFAAQTLK